MKAIRRMYGRHTHCTHTHEGAHAYARIFPFRNKRRKSAASVMFAHFRVLLCESAQYTLRKSEKLPNLIIGNEGETNTCHDGS